jgi:hypothetical protein
MLLLGNLCLLVSNYCNKWSAFLLYIKSSNFLELLLQFPILFASLIRSSKIFNIVLVLLIRLIDNITLSIAIRMIIMQSSLFALVNLIIEGWINSKCFCYSLFTHDTMDNSKVLRLFLLVLQLLMYINPTQKTIMAWMCVDPSHQLSTVVCYLFVS